MKTPKTGYYVVIDAAPTGDETTATQTVQNLRRELRPLGIHVRVLDLKGSNGMPELMLTTLAVKRLSKWLLANGYEYEEVINARNPNAIPRDKFQDQTNG